MTCIENIKLALAQLTGWRTREQTLSASKCILHYRTVEILGVILKLSGTADPLHSQPF
jgi:hypothetical protein